MSILHVFAGSNDKEVRLKQLIAYVVASPEKKRWQGLSFSQNPNMVKMYGIPDQGSLSEIYAAMILPHIAYGYPGRRLCYHCLIDFNGLLGASDAGVVAWEINRFLLQYGVQYVQGVHINKSNGQRFWPHVHVLINTISLFGPKQGRKFRIEKPVLRKYMEHMNRILAEYALPVIPIYTRKIRLDKKEHEYDITDKKDLF